jgi:N-ethylmaleimide reductase
MFQHFRPLYHGHLIAYVEMTQERGNRLIKTGLADSIAFGRPYIANPDLPERFLIGATLNEVSWPTVYASGPEGYIDYPAMQRSFPNEAPPTRARRRPEPLLS